MKTKIFTLLAILGTLFFSCSKDEGNEFDYPIDVLYGSWDGIAISTDNGDSWHDVSVYPYTKFQFAIKFNSDGTYYGSGFLGNGSGTYTAKGSRITTYIDGEEFLYYDIKSFSANKAEAVMAQKGSDSTIGIKLEKQ